MASRAGKQAVRWGWLFSGLLAAAGPAAAQGACGPIILGGHDADDHGFEWVYAGLFDELMRNVGNGRVGILAIGADPGTSAALWIANVASQMATPQAVTLVNDAAIASIDFHSFAIVHVPSDIFDTPGGISQAEADLLTARAADIGAFQSLGGGLFGLTQGQLNQGWSWMGGVGSFTHIDVPPSGQLPSLDLFDDVTATAEGMALGIDDLNLDGCCFHNVFPTYPSWLRVLAWANEPSDPAYNQQAVFVGGINRCQLLAVTWGDVRAARVEGGVEVSWSTLSESATLGFEVWRVAEGGGPEASGERVGDGVEARGALSSYRVLDRAPSADAPLYYVREIASSGAASISEPVRVSVAGADGAAAGVGAGARMRSRERGR